MASEKNLAIGFKKVQIEIADKFIIMFSKLFLGESPTGLLFPMIRTLNNKYLVSSKFIY